MGNSDEPEALLKGNRSRHRSLAATGHLTGRNHPEPLTPNQLDYCGTRTARWLMCAQLYGRWAYNVGLQIVRDFAHRQALVPQARFGEPGEEPQMRS